jgi:riboflavin synthase
MFTGIIQAIGSIAAQQDRGADRRVLIHTGTLDLSDVRVGDSICVNGVCLTATELSVDGFWCDVSGETLARTTLAELRAGSAVNLEKSLLPTTRMGGHLVSGHVDGVAHVAERGDDGRSVRFRIRVPANLAKYVAEKGSVCLDGVSLTVNSVHDGEFDVNIVPHTQQETTLGFLQVGQRVNVEVDLIARYVERLLSGNPS